MNEIDVIALVSNSEAIFPKVTESQAIKANMGALISINILTMLLFLFMHESIKYIREKRKCR